ncbi:MAG: YegP family protein [Clostridia bacterium]|nr:YegP family protein [Clostridia bacterium]
MGKFVIKATKTGFTFSLKAVNGEIVAVGGEVYNTIDACKNGCESVRTNAPIANLEDQTIEGFEEQKHPKFEIYKDKAGQFRFRLKAKNGQIIAASEGYVKKDSCKNGIDSVRRNAPDAPVLEPAPEEKAE